MATIQFLTTIELGAGVSALLPGALTDLGIRRPLWVTDRSIVEAGLFDRVAAAFTQPIDRDAVFDATPPNPTEAAVGAALGRYHDAGCDAVVNAVLLPHVLRFNQSHVGDKFDRLRATFGLAADADLAGAFAALTARSGMPASLAAMGVPASARERVVAGALADHSLPTNPRPLDAEALGGLFDQAMQ